MKKITSIKQTCLACPEQYEGTLNTGEVFYVRCRNGQARLDVGTEEQYQDHNLPTVSTIWFDEPLKGYFEEEEIQELFKQADIEIDESFLKEAQEKYLKEL